MDSKLSPFTRTPGVAGTALIETHYSEEIIINFESRESFKYLYKIVGLRGSGKSVEYSIVLSHFRKQKKWLVYSLSAGGDPLQTILSEMSKESFINDKSLSTTVQGSASAEGNIAVLSTSASLNASVNIKDNDHYYSDEADFKEMLKKAAENEYRVLIGIDDIAKTDRVARFLSILGTVFMEEDKDVRFICTGLEKNIEDFADEPHLSFFVRSESINIKPLDLHNIAGKYRLLLNISYPEAVSLSQFTLGYAYGYQVLGEICFKRHKSAVDEEVEEDFDEMIGQQYDLIWSTLTDAEKELVKIVVNSASGAVSEIKSKMKNSSGFASLRDRLKKKHILVSLSRGTVTVPLPRFKEYINLWY